MNNIIIRKEEIRKQVQERKEAKALEKQRARIHEELDAYQKKRKKAKKVSPKDSYISLQHINKIYDNHVQAVYDFNLDIKQHEFIVFVGPSGCGKSTTLRMIAGLEDITSGDLFIDNMYANDLAPKDRDIAMVFQSYALYPHMSVFGNMAFGLKIRKVPTKILNKDGTPYLAINKGLIKDLKKERKNLYEYTEMMIKDNGDKKIIEEYEKEIKLLDKKINYLEVTPVEIYKKRNIPKDVIQDRVDEAAKILQIEEYLNRKPKALSGGQCQRVALGRAIVRNAKVFLMDEPLSNLDAKLRVSMRSEIIKLHKKLNATTIYVTHDQTEAMTMASRIVVMNKGKIQQIGTPIEIYNHPANVFVATFIGSPAMNLFDITFKDNTITFEDGSEILLPKVFNKKKEEFFIKELENCKKMFIELEKKFKEKNDCLNKIEVLKEKIKTSNKEKTRASLENEINKIKEQIIIFERANEERNYLLNAISEYEKIIQNKEVKLTFGIRPEDVYIEGHADTNGTLSNTLSLKVNVAELLGHEYFVHTDFAKKDLVVKINAKHIINTEDKINLLFDLSRIHLFDKVSSKLIY